VGDDSVRPAVSLAEIVRQAGPELERTRPLSREQRAALCAIVRCRTAALGGHLYGCPQCGRRHLVWHSCRNRHCPRCQSQASHRWLEQRRREVLPVPYFHVVFTVPESLNAFALADPRTFYDVLFRATSRTLLDLAADPRRLGLRIGLIAVLHTWGQTLTLHPHIHCVVPAAGIAQATGRFAVARRRNFFLPVRVLSRYFRRLFLQMLGEALRTNDELRQRTAHLDCAGLFQTARAAEWVVYAKAPFAGPEQVLAYLGPLHPSHRHLRASHPRLRRPRRAFPLEGLSGCQPAETDATPSLRVPSALSSSCAAAALRAHPSLRNPRKPLPRAPPVHGPSTTARPGSHANALSAGSSGDPLSGLRGPACLH